MMAIEGMAAYRAWLADPDKSAERNAYFGVPQLPREDWPVDRRELIQRHTEIGSMALQWAVENFRKATDLEAAP